MLSFHSIPWRSRELTKNPTHIALHSKNFTAGSPDPKWPLNSKCIFGRKMKCDLRTKSYNKMRHGIGWKTYSQLWIAQAQKGPGTHCVQIILEIQGDWTVLYHTQMLTTSHEIVMLAVFHQRNNLLTTCTQNGWMPTLALETWKVHLYCTCTWCVLMEMMFCVVVY